MIYDEKRKIALIRTAGGLAAHLHELTPGVDYRIGSLIVDMFIAAGRGNYTSEAAAGGWNYQREVGQ